MGETTVITKSLEKGIKKLQKVFTDDSIVDEVRLVAAELLRRAIDSPIPSDMRMLANSDTINVNVKKKQVTFGFNREYAAFQDAPGRSAPYVITPKRKKALFVPLNQKGRQHREGNNPNLENLEWGKDYVLAKKVVIPIKPYGSATGPNHYFSETIKRNTNFALEALTLRLRKRGEEALRKEGGGNV